MKRVAMLRFRGDLRRMLELRGLTQPEFAFAAGLSLTTISRAVRGELISPAVFGKIIRALGSIEPIISNGRAAPVAKVAGKTRRAPSAVKR